MKMLTLLLNLLGLVIGVYCAREEDRITEVPGLEPQPTFATYSGYLNATSGNRFFYWFVESEGNPAEDPLVLWLNGGPGCSSLYGFFVEHGPWRVNPDGETLQWFDYRWNKLANMLYMESPQCVGFSYNEDGNCETGDDQVAIDNQEALQDFLVGFPEFAENELFLTGESYAGIYVPLLAQRLLDDATFNFQGFAVGNAVTDNPTMDNALVHYEWARGILGSQFWNDIVLACCPDGNATFCKFSEYNETNSECRRLNAEVQMVTWNSGLNPYNYLNDCAGGAIAKNGVIAEDENSITLIHPGTVPMSADQLEQYMEFYREMLSSDKDVHSDAPCLDTSNVQKYLNTDSVREAIHVSTSLPAWEMCSSIIGNYYDRQYDSMEDQYLDVLAQNKRVLVFNGDLDLACNHLGDMWFVQMLEQELVEEYKTWFYETEVDNTTQVAGYALQYENLVYLHVKGSGHMVPEDTPQQGLILFRKFLDDEPY